MAAPMVFEERPAPQVTCGIYVLLQGEEAIYVGKSIQVEFRVLHHRLVRGLEFDRVRVCPCEPDELDRLEQEAIRRLLPTLNVQHNPNAPRPVAEPEKVRRLHEAGADVAYIAHSYRISYAAVREMLAEGSRPS